MSLAIEIRRVAASRATAVAVVLIASGISQFPTPTFGRRSDLEPLLFAASVAPRSLEPRLMGFAWTPLAPRTRGTDEDDVLAEMKLMAMAGLAVERCAHDETASGRHCIAAARLLAGKPNDALAVLEAMDIAAHTPTTWNDLAAANYALVTAGKAPEHIKDALAAADAALGIAPDALEPLFNRALIIERFGLPDLARQAWRTYLLHDGSSPWAVEASQHLHRLSLPRRDFRREFDLDFAKLADGNEAAAHDLVSAFPQESRTWGEAEILGRWAESLLRGDTNVATRHLNVARAIASELRARSGEALLSDAINAIDQSGAARRLDAANAFAAYRKGRQVYAAHKPGEAEPILRDAAIRFEAIEQPMALVARYFEAATIFDQYKTDRAMAILEELRRKVPPQYRALTAQLNWQAGLGEIASARWRSALTTLSASATTFEQLGELRNAASQHALLAEVHDRLGNSREAWSERLAAITGLSSMNDLRYRTSIAGATREAMLSREWRCAASLVALEIELADRARADDLYVDALIRSALIGEHNGNRMLARDRISQASSALATLSDPAARDRLGVDLHFAEVIASDYGNSAQAVDGLTRAIAFHSAGGRRMFLPELLLARSRTWSSAGNRGQAWRDVSEAIEEIERQRTASPEGYRRAAILDTASDAFEVAVSMSLDNGDLVRALRYSDRFRARVLLDSVAANVPPPALDQIPPNQVVIEYMALADRLVIFVVGKKGITHAEVPVKPSVLRAGARACAEAVARGEERAGTEIERLLIEPAKSLFPSGTNTVVIVADPQLNPVPYAALFDSRSGRYLIEEYAVAVAPSVSVYLRGEVRRQSLTQKASEHLLVVGDPANPQAAPLQAAGREATMIAALYFTPSILLGPRASRSSFLQHLQSASVVHFAGHAVTEESGPDTALLLAPDGTNEGRLSASEISTLSLPATRLVILAACSTAAGESRGGEGPWSLARGFLSAGVPTVIATQWPIDDEWSRSFFIRVHERLLQGATPAEAVRATQLEEIRRNVSARSWAGIQVIGSP